MADPTNVQYCKVVGRFRAFVADGVDGGDNPDFISMTGTGTIRANTPTARNTGTGNVETYIPYPITVTLDADGYISLNAVPYVMVVAPGGDINPPDFNYTIELNLATALDATPIPYGPYVFNVVAGGEVDLTTAIPVTPSGAPMVTKGDKGDPATLTLGTVTTLPTGTQAGALLTGSPPNYTMDVSLPQGPAGAGVSIDQTVGVRVFSAPAAGVIERTQYAQNPRATINTTGWTAGTGGTPGTTGFTRVTDNFSGQGSGPQAFSLAASAVDAVNDFAGAYYDTVAAPGQVWSAGMLGRFNAAAPASVAGRLVMEFRDASSALASHESAWLANTITAPTLMKVENKTAPAGTTIVRIYPQVFAWAATSAAAVDFRFTDVIHEKDATAGTFFDGSTTWGGDFHYRWTGTIRASTSVASNKWMVYGDTGRRNISSLFTSGVAAEVFISRIGSIVHCEYSVFDSVGGRSITIVLPTGFKYTNNSGGEQIFTGRINSTPPEISRGSVASSLSLASPLLAAGRSIAGTATWTTTDPWPASLPGTAGT